MSERILVYDNGLHVELASYLASKGHEVAYFTPRQSPSFPRSAIVLIGGGIEGVERVRDFWSAMPDYQYFVFPDTYDGDLQEYLRSIGKYVWGSGTAQEYELDRWKMRSLQRELGMPIPRTRLVHGTDELQKLMEKETDFYVKVNYYRGDMETFHHVKWELSRPWFDELVFWLGPRQKTIDFLIESTIKGVEVGFDGYMINSQMPPMAAYGYEIKDQGFVGRVAAYDEMPAGLLEVNSLLAPHLQGLQGFFSHECWVTKEGKYYMIDPCVRSPSPPSEAYQVVYENLDGVILAGARGEILPLEPMNSYYALIVMKSDWAREHWLAVEVPKNLRAKVKLRHLAIVDGQTYTAPLQFDAFGYAIGVGDTIEAAIKDCIDVSQEVEAYEYDAPLDALTEASEVIEKGEEFGIEF